MKNVINWKYILIFILLLLLAIIKFNSGFSSYVHFRWLCFNDSGFVVNDEIHKGNVWLANDYFNALLIAQHHPEVRYVRFYSDGNLDVKKDLHYKVGPKRDKSSYEVKKTNLLEEPSYELETRSSNIENNNMITRVAFRVVKLNPRLETDTFFTSYELNFGRTDFFISFFENIPKRISCSGNREVLTKFNNFFVK